MLPVTPSTTRLPASTSYELSAISCQPLATSYQPSAVSLQRRAISQLMARVQRVEEAQAMQSQVRIGHVDDGRLRDDDRRQAAGRDHQRIAPELGSDALDQPFDQTNVAKDRPGPDRRYGVATDCPPRRFQLHRE